MWGNWCICQTEPPGYGGSTRRKSLPTSEMRGEWEPAWQRPGSLSHHLPDMSRSSFHEKLHNN